MWRCDVQSCSLRGVNTVLSTLMTWWNLRQAQRSARERREIRADALMTLLDRTKDIDAREAAARYLSAFDDLEVELALVQVASDPATDSEIAERCGLSLGPIWSGKAELDLVVLEQLQPIALQALADWLSGINEEWDRTFSDVLYPRSAHPQP
jgi:hypothetical protein